jgi:hypothetical protein
VHAALCMLHINQPLCGADAHTRGCQSNRSTAASTALPAPSTTLRKLNLF